MKRQIIPVDRVVKCHVNSVDGSPAYEASTAYEAGTLVIYNDDAFTAIVDIEDSDTDTPVEAPDKWALTPNAFRTSGDSGLTDRVSALEAIVDNPDTVPTEDSDALITSGGVFAALADIDDKIDGKYVLKQALTSLQVTADGVKTVADLLDELSAAFTAAAAALDDTEMIEPLVLFCSGYAWSGAVGTNYVTNETTSFNIPFDRSVVSGGALYHYVAIFADTVGNQNKLDRILSESTPAITVTSVLTDVPVADTKFEIQYRIWQQA